MSSKAVVKWMHGIGEAKEPKSKQFVAESA